MRFISIFLVMFLASVQVFADGKIAGKVSDEKTGEPIIGAVVMVKGTAAGAATDIDGQYTLSIPAGTYVVELKYIGYQTKNIEEVTVKDGQVTTVNSILSEASGNTLEEVVVTATLKKESVNALYVMQKNSISVSSGISADIIQRTPDRNTGEVLKRVSGASVKDNKYVIIRGLSDRYNLAMVNNALMPSTEPDQKAFSFDVIPSNLIDNIIINKTASADLPGDFAGGIVQVLTKDVPEQNFFNIGIGAGYNSQSTFKEFKSNEQGGTAILGFPAKNELPSSFGNNRAEYHSMSESQRLNAAKELPNNYKVVTGNALPNMSLQASLGNVAKVGKGKLGTVAGLSYATSQRIGGDFRRGTFLTDGGVNSYAGDNAYYTNANLAGLANISYVFNKSKISFKNLYNKIYESVYYERSGFSTSSDQATNMYSTVPSERQIYNTQLDGDHAFGDKNVKLTWNLNYSSLNSKQHDLRTAFYARYATFGEDGEPETSTEPMLLIDRNSRRFFSDQVDNNFGGNANLAYPFELFGQKQTVKVGYLGMYKTREYQARIFQYAPNGSGNINHEIGTQPVGEIFEPGNIGVNKLEIDEITNPSDRYEANAMLNAAYFMFDNALSDKWRLTWGVRFESYTQNLKAVDLSLAKINKEDVFTDLLPSFNLSYDVNDKSKIRLGASRTMNRPEFREISPMQFLDLKELWTLQGNPNLKRANVNNIDLRYEIYPNPGETITFGVFYKNFENPIEAKMDDQSNLDLLIFSYANAKSANSVGAELEVRKNLSFMGEQKWLENFTVGGNVSYIYSKVDASNIIGKSNNIGTKADRPLQGQSPYLINLSALYNDAKTGLALSAMYNRIGRRIYIVGNGSIPTTWENGRDVIDLQLSKAVLKNRGELKFTVGDLLNQKTVFYWNTDNNDGYKKGTDKAATQQDGIFRQYRLGTTYTVGFTYRFGK